MNNEFDKIDDFLKQKVDGSHFTVNEAHWEDALRRLDQKKDKKRPLFWLFGVLLLTGAAATGAGLYFNSINHAVVTADNVNIDNVISTPNMENREIINSNNSSNISAAAIAVNNPINNSQEGKRSSKKVVSNAMPISISKPMRDNKTAATNKRTLLNSKVANNNMRRNVAARNSQPKKLSNLQPQPKLVVNTPKNLVEANIAQDNIAALRPNLNKRKGDNLVKNSNDLASKQPMRIYKSMEEMQALNPRYVKGLENYEYEVTEIKLDKEASASLRASINAPRSNPSQKEAIEPINIVSVQQVERDFNSFYLLAGFSAARGYQGNVGDKSVYGLSPNLGIGYQFAVRDNVNVYFSLFASYLNHLNITETSKQTTYSFDKITKEIEVARKNLIEIHAPITVGYRINERHALLGGVGLTYGVNTLSGVNNGNQQTTELGYTNGLRSLDANFHTGYEFKFSDRVRMNVMYQQGLFDMTQNEYFDNDQTDRNRRISIGVRFNFKNK